MKRDSFNHCTFSGWLIRGADPCTTRSGRTILMFMLHVRIKEEEYQLKMRVEDPALVAEYAPWLTPGRAVYVHCRVTPVPYERAGVVKGDVLVFEVLDAEFPNRSKEKSEEHAPEKQTAEVGA